MTTREQDLEIEKMAEKHGRAKVVPQVDQSVIVVGLAGDVEMEYRRVYPDGATAPAEHMRPRTVVVAKSIRSYKVIINGAVHAARTEEEAAGVLLDALTRTDAVALSLRGCTSLTRDRLLTAEEQARIVQLAADLKMKRSREARPYADQAEAAAVFGEDVR